MYLSILFVSLCFSGVIKIKNIYCIYMYIYSIYIYVYRTMLVYPLQPNGLLKHLFSGYSNCCIHDVLLFSRERFGLFPVGLREHETGKVGYSGRLPHICPWETGTQRIHFSLCLHLSFHCTHVLVRECNKKQNNPK